jgi:DNA-binding transcriptional LysR family regulator
MGTLADSTATARKLATGGRSVLATPAYFARAGEPKNPADLADHEAVVYGQTVSVWSFSSGGTESSVAVRGRVRVSAAEGLRAAVLADMGVTIASDWMFALDLWAVFPAGRMASAKAREFANFVETVMADGHSVQA